MLASISRLRLNRFINNPTVRTLASNSSVTNHGVPQANKQSFANENFQERVHIAYKNSQKRIFTIPNILTMSRMAVTPAVGYFIWTGANSQALACFAYAALTDLLDGFIARKFKQDSDLGAVLDPLADKLLLTTCFVALFNVNLMPMWLVKGFILRDIIIVLGGITVRYYGFKERPTLKRYFDMKNYPTIGFEPTLTGKFNTALQCLLIVLHLSTNQFVGLPVYDWSMSLLHYGAAATTTFSLMQYTLRANRYNTYVLKPKSRG